MLNFKKDKLQAGRKHVHSPYSQEELASRIQNQHWRLSRKKQSRKEMDKRAAMAPREDTICLYGNAN